MTSYTVLVGKGARGRYMPRLTLTGRAALPFARLTAAMVPAGYRAKIEPVA